MTEFYYEFDWSSDDQAGLHFSKIVDLESWFPVKKILDFEDLILTQDLT